MNADRAAGGVSFAHISDVHLPSPLGARAGDFFGKRLTGLLSWRLRRCKVHQRGVLEALRADIVARSPAHLVISGDLVNLALPSEIAAARLWLSDFEQQLLGAAAARAGGVIDNDGSGAISVVPGNHDFYVAAGGALALEQWSRWMRSAGSHSALALSAAEAMPSQPADNGLDGFPYLRQVGDLAFIGMNTGAATLPLVARGYLSERQLHRLPQLLRRLGEAGRKRVLVLHHPPLVGEGALRAKLRRLKLSHTNAVLAAVRQHGCELIIHGHNHVIQRHYVEGANGAIVPVAGISSASSGARGAPSAWALYRIDDSNRVHARWRVWHESEQKFRWMGEEQAL